MPVILYSFRRCPYAMRARLALYIAGVRYETREVSLRDKPAHMLEISPKGTVPVLWLPGEKRVIDESLDIMLWAIAQGESLNMIPKDRRDEIFALIAQNDGAFKRALDRYKYPSRYPNEDCAGAFAAGAEILHALNARLAIGGALCGTRDTLADYAIFPFVRQFAHTDAERFAALKLTPLSDWLARHKSSPAFAEIMKKIAA